LIYCITIAGDAYCLLLGSEEQSVRQIFKTGVRDGLDLQVEIASSPDVTQAIFNNYSDKVSIPALSSNRSLAGCENTGDSLLR
jgi:hypothetical protein